MLPAPIAMGLPAEAKQPTNSSNNHQGTENNAFIGWVRPETNNRKGGSGVGETMSLTAGPLGGNSLSRLVSYDSATPLGLPRHDYPEIFLLVYCSLFAGVLDVSCMLVLSLWRLFID